MIIHRIRIWWNIVFSIVMIVLPVDMFIRPENLFIRYFGDFKLVKQILESIGMLPTATILFLLGLLFLFDAIKAFNNTRNEKII